MAIRNLKGDPIETSIQKDARSFSRALAKLGKFCEENYEAIVTKTVIDLFASIAELTPVDTGRAKANWALGMSPTDTNYADITNADNFEYRLRDGTTIWIYNNLVYIVPLEEGHSKQAPRGMVAVSLKRFRRFLNKAAKDLSNVVQPDA
ncbi:MAG: hypothetical protein ACYTBJ_00975 [Planctomycetota bacterium]|jgi:hypothetical protein